MVKPTIQEQVIEALKNAEVLEAIGKAIAPLIKGAVDEGLNAHMTTINNTLKDIKQNNSAILAQLKQVKEENVELKSRLSAAEARLEALDRDSRMCNIVIRGLPDGSYSERGTAASEDSEQVSHESVVDTVIKFCEKDLKVAVAKEDIASSFRMAKGRNERFRPILVRCANKRTKDAIYTARKTLWTEKKPMFLNEHLTKLASELYGKARALVKERKIRSAWTSNGQVFIKLDEDPTTRPKLIKYLDDLPR